MARGAARDESCGMQITAAEFKSHVAELARLHELRDHDLPAQLREMRGLVTSDAAEEVVQLHLDRAQIEARIARIERILRDAHVADGDGDPGVVAVGCAVRVRDTGSGGGRESTYAITGASSPGGVSAGSPVGSALLGRRAGEIVSVELPDGRVRELEVLEVAPVAAAAA